MLRDSTKVSPATTQCHSPNPPLQNLNFKVAAISELLLRSPTFGFVFFCFAAVLSFAPKSLRQQSEKGRFKVLPRRATSVSGHIISKSLSVDTFCQGVLRFQSTGLTNLSIYRRVKFTSCFIFVILWYAQCIELRYLKLAHR